ncbi:dolichol kinase [Thermoplasmatales archaeon SG8-52-4]|nr:MAG: dolichol kinase [Thermoplasmatales archaeon SG8-52-4]
MVKVIEKIQDTKRIINSIDFDAHWYRRVFHTFGASFLIYYMLPTDIHWINFLKSWIPIIIVNIAIVLEVLRLKGKINSDYFFGLRVYEKNRVGSYVFFGVAILILLRFFPQQIAIPCILCACIADPLMGEIRNRFGIKYVYIFGFVICMLFFMISWYKADIRLLLIASIFGAIGAVIGETKKFWWIDDDFMIQMVPAVMLFIIWISIPYLGFNYPDPIIYQGVIGV